MSLKEQRKLAFVKYLTVSNLHRAAEAKLEGDNLLPLDDVYKAIDELNNYFEPEMVDTIIINSVELYKKYLLNV